MRKQWELKTLSADHIAPLPDLPPLIVRLLALRGLADPQAIAEFLNPDYASLHDPFLFQAMRVAVARINQALEKKEKITIFADYDADAITAAAVVFLALKKLGAAVEAYIPDRFTEGYGINSEALRKIAENGTKLVITVDCGTNAVAEATLCKELGMDLIITDHHEITGELPRAAALINPKNPQDKYPFPFLTGVGVAFKLVQALFAGREVAGFEKWLLDLVAVGTVADLQSLRDENRVLVSFGLNVIAKTRWVGLRALIQQAELKGPIDAYTLGFIIAPRINAAGRIAHANVAFELLTSEDPTRATELARELNELNKHRQMLTEQIMSEAKAQIEMIADKKILLAFGVDWPKGVVGLVAGKLAEEYNRPVLAVSTTDDGMAVGSGRSTANFDLVAALTYAKDLLERYGGHTQAAGFSLKSANLQDFHRKLLDYADEKNLVALEPTLYIDAEVAAEDLNWRTYEYLEKFTPFGFGNPKPKFLAKNLQVKEFRKLGANSQHLRLKLKLDDVEIPGIAFNQAFFADQIQPGKTIDVVFELSSNEWNGNKELQMKIFDLKISTND